MEIEAAMAVKEERAAESVARSNATEVKAGSFSREVANGPIAESSAEDCQRMLANCCILGTLRSSIPDLGTAKSRSKD